MAIEIEEPHQRVVACRRQPPGRPGENGRGPAHHQWGNGAHREGVPGCAVCGPFGPQGKQGTVEPAGLRVPRCSITALEHILAVKMRALAIGTCHGVHNACRAGSVQPVKVWHCGIEHEERVKRQPWRGAAEHEPLLPAQRGPVRVPDGGDGG